MEASRAGKSFQSIISLSNKFLAHRPSDIGATGLPAFSSVVICPNNYLKPCDWEVKHRQPGAGTRKKQHQIIGDWEKLLEVDMIVPASLLSP